VTHGRAYTLPLVRPRLQNEQERGGDMPRAPSEKVTQAEKLFNDGMAMVEIAKKLEVSDGTVRSWKNRYGWGKASKKNKCNVAKKNEKKNATLQKKKRGGQPKNQNAKGGSGNPNPNPPPDRTKHGGYVPVFMDALDSDEQELLGSIPEDTELQLMEQIQLFSIRERRILKAINKYREQKGEVAVMDVNRSESKRSFKDQEEEAEYDRRQKEKVDNKEILPGKSYNIATHTANKDMIIARLEQELSTVQSKKTKAIEALSKYRIEKARLESESAGNDAVDDWIAAVLGEEVSEDE
jgi:putative ATPase subunit of terminase (gpP-like)